MKAAVTLVAAVFFLCLVVVGVVAGPPFVDAWNAVAAAEADGRVDKRTWQETSPPHIAHAMLAVEFFAQDRGGYSPAQAIERYLGPSRRRDLRGHLMAIFKIRLLEARYTPDQLIDDYARQAYFGRNAYGVDAAARAWFGKPEEQLSVGEAAFLVGVLKGPSNYENIERATERRNIVLARMQELGYISAAELNAERAAPLCILPR